MGLMAQTSVPMREVMFRTALNLSTDLADELRRLPAGHATYALEDAYLTVGPAGVFVLVDAEGDVAGACRRAADHATRVRTELADLMAWVPFVDAVAVTDRHDYDPGQPALVIPPDLVRFTVSDGPRTVDADTLARLHLLRFPRLI